MAVYGFKGLGWFATSLAVALGGYMVMSQGAAERARLHTLDVRIAEAKRDIRNLDTEFATRASLAQLERWNGEGLGMAAPATQQFVADETALADLDRTPTEEIEKVALVVPAGAKVQTAAAVVVHDPAGTAQAEPHGGARPSNRAVAMVDPRQLLSPSTMGDLERTAASERQALR
jgi:hypothetical protein